MVNILSTCCNYYRPSNLLTEHLTTHYCCFLVQFENILNRYCLSKCLYILLAPSSYINKTGTKILSDDR
ncbi:hypothetical protein C0J52_23914 [Blattella germanica]|nr:hypothetical protein C0J52_23914 [Blattella germanica]